MYFLLSGEGATDLGIVTHSTDSEVCAADQFAEGPIAVLIDRLVQQLHYEYSFLKYGTFGYVTESRLAGRAEGIRPLERPAEEPPLPQAPPVAAKAGRGLRLPSREVARNTRDFYGHARALAQLAKQWESALSEDVFVVYFRDADGNASAGFRDWKAKRDSMLTGFGDEGFARGVPAVPRPKSEAWLLCVLRDPPHAPCRKLEERSGSDKSPDSLKAELATVLKEKFGVPFARETLRDLIKHRPIDYTKIDLPSFTAFRERLEEVVQGKRTKPDTPPT